MWFDVQRLLRSDTWVLGSSDEKAAAITLWMESWHQVPAASLPSNDRILAKLSGAERWAKAKEHALRGWILCSDGRLYHPVVAEKALEAWVEKLASAINGAAGNAKRWQIAVDTTGLRQQLRFAVDRLRALCPHSRVLKKRAVAIILGAGEAPDSVPPDDRGPNGNSSPPDNDPPSPPDDRAPTVAPSPPDAASASPPDRSDQTRPDRTGPDLSLKESTPVNVGPPEPDAPPPAEPAAVLPPAPPPPAPPPPAAAATPAERGTRLSKDWALPKPWGEWAMAEFPQWTADKVRTEGLRFRDHWSAKTGKDATKVDWLATWRNWCRSDLAHRDDPRLPIRRQAQLPIDTAARSAETRQLLGFGSPTTEDAPHA